MPDKIPVVPIVATLPGLQLQAPLGVASFCVIEEPAHTFPGPVIPAGDVAFTVTTKDV